MANISFYGSHNAAYVVEENGKILMVLEVERFLNYKNSGMAQYKCPRTENLLFYAKYIPEWIMKKLNITEFENCYHLNTDVLLPEGKFQLEQFIPAKNYEACLHHEAHAAGCFYQSPHKEMLVFSFDGGGNDGKFNVYHCVRGESPRLLETVLSPNFDSPHIHYDLGFPYMMIAHYLDDIKYQDLGSGNLVYPGKIMGLASYGKVREEWIPAFTEFYKSNPSGISLDGTYTHNSIRDYQVKIKKLGDALGLEFVETADGSGRFKEELAWDLAATSQRVFEDCFLEVALPYIDQHPELPIGITGGCGLNILLNTRLVTEFNKDVFVGPDPNDCGIALGVMLSKLRPEEAVDSTYLGTELLDLDNFIYYSQNTNVLCNTSYLNKDTLIKDLVNGKIIGVARGRAEHGPRALGNRSIICNPSFPEMKDILNAKVKHREWYRPFAPVVRLEDVNKYFEWDKESRWMSFCPKVREEWREKLAAITHVDGTARVQTVIREQNEFIYDLLTEFEKQSGIGVLLNTSFNVDGKPILSTVKDAFTILEKTEMDCLLIEDYYVRKP